MVTEKQLLTAEEFIALPDDSATYELLDGVVVPVTPPGGEHGRVLTEVAFLLRLYVGTHHLGHLLSGDAGIILGRNPDRVRGPDVCFYAAGRLPAGPLSDGFLEIVPDLVVEIISPSDRPAAVRAKIDEWLAAGVRLVWAVYPKTHSVVAYRGQADIQTYAESDLITGAPVLPDFSCRVGSFFAEMD